MIRVPRAPRRPLLLIGFLALALLAPAATADNQERTCARLLALAEANPRLELAAAEHEASNTRFVQGAFTVPEDRAADAGRELRLGFVVLPARAEDPAPDPVFVLHGGPGAPASAFFQREVNGWLRQHRDVVLIDQRGTGSSNKLHVPMSGSDDDLQGYFESYFQPAAYAAALPRLQARAFACWDRRRRSPGSQTTSPSSRRPSRASSAPSVWWRRGFTESRRSWRRRSWTWASVMGAWG